MFVRDSLPNQKTMCKRVLLIKDTSHIRSCGPPAAARQPPQPSGLLDKTAGQRKMALKASIAVLEKASAAKAAAVRDASKAKGKRKASTPDGKGKKHRGLLN